MPKRYPAVLIACAFIFTAIVYRYLPIRMPTQFGMGGEVTGWRGRPSVAFALPVLTLALWALMRRLPFIDPRGANYAQFAKTYSLVVNGLVVFMVTVHVLVLGMALGWPFYLDRLIPLGVGALFVVLGCTLPSVRPNWRLGIRTPWALSSDTVWVRTHRVGGYLMIAAGVVCIFAIRLRASWQVSVVVAAGATAVVGSVVFSYFAWKQEQS